MLTNTTLNGDVACLFFENFSSGTPPTGWTIENPDGSEGWEFTNVTGSGGNSTRVTRMDNYQYNAAGQLDFLTMPELDLSRITSPRLVFDVAYAAFGPNNFERLNIEYSTDGGNTWQATTYEKEDLELATTGYQGSGWGPQQASDWRIDTVDISAYATATTLFRFVQTAGYGNGLFIDNVRVITEDQPVADFGTAGITVCRDETISLTDESANVPTSWNWSFSPNTITFQEGTSASSQNPRVSFNAVGTYTITLSVTSANGTTSITRSNAVATIGETVLPLEEGFSASSLPTGWAVLNPDNDEGWEFTTTTGSDGNSTRVIRMDNYQYNAPGELDYLVLPELNLDGIQDPVMIFDVAYAAFGPNNFEQLKLEYSPDCGENFFSTAYAKEGLELATTGYQGNGWGPQQASDWRTDTLDLSAYASGSVVLRFVQTAGYGNGLFLDNIRILEALALPLDLLSFTGETLDKTNRLSWTTANEEGFDRFVVQRSANGRDWRDLGAVAGAMTGLESEEGETSPLSPGEGPGVRSYTFTDATPLPDGYYRLRMEDFDGSFTFSEVLHLQRPNDNASTLSVYPNPNNGPFIIDLPLDDGETAELSLYDSTGRRLFQQNVRGRFEQTTELPAGVYLLTAELAGERVTRRVVVR